MHKLSNLPDRVNSVSASQNGDLLYSSLPGPSDVFTGTPKLTETKGLTIIPKKPFAANNDKNNGWIYRIPKDGIPIRFTGRGTIVSSFSDGRLAYLNHEGTLFEELADGSWKQHNLGEAMFHLSISPDDKIWLTAKHQGVILNIDKSGHLGKPGGNGWLIAANRNDEHWVIRKNDPMDIWGSLHRRIGSEWTDFKTIRPLHVAISADGLPWVIDVFDTKTRILVFRESTNEWENVADFTDARAIVPLEGRSALIIRADGSHSVL